MDDVEKLEQLRKKRAALEAKSELKIMIADEERRIRKAKINNSKMLKGLQGIGSAIAATAQASMEKASTGQPKKKVSSGKKKKKKEKEMDFIDRFVGGF